MMTVPEVNSEPIPGYRLLEPLGKGSFGEVWKCEAPAGLYKAIKFVRSTSGNAASRSASPELEFRALEQIKAIRHPFLLSIERVEFINGDLVIVMELAERSLADLFGTYRKCGRPGIPRDDLLGYLREAAEVLDLMKQEHGLQHLDVKPQNLFLVGRHIKVADYGLVSCLATLHGEAPHTVQLESVTPFYAAPESFLGKTSAFSDQYSLAITYCEMLSGALPFTGKNFRQLATQHLQAPPNLDLLSESDRGPVYRALAKDPGKRFASCGDFVAALSAVPTSNNGRTLQPAANATASPRPPVAPSYSKPLADDNSPLDETTPTHRPALKAAVPAPREKMRISPDMLSPSEPKGNELDNYRLLECVSRLPGGELWKGQTLGGQPCSIRFIFDADVAVDPVEGPSLDRLLALKHSALAPLEIIQTGSRLALIHTGGDCTMLNRLKERHLAGEQGIPRSELIGYLRVVAEGIDALYKSSRLQHLTLTPKQMFLLDDQARLVDFGLMELFWLPAGHHGAALNPRYAPPELFAGQITRSCDQYSLALIFQELLTSAHPFRNLNPRQLASPRTRNKPDLGMLPATDRPVVLKALNGDPEKRFGSCLELVAALVDASASKSYSMSLPAAEPEPVAPSQWLARPASTSVETPNVTAAARPATPSPEAPRVTTTMRPLAHLLAAPVSEAVGQFVENVKGDRQIHTYKKIRYLLTPGVCIEHHCFARLMPSTVKLQLEELCHKWCAKLVEANEDTYVFHVPIKGSFMERLRGLWPRLALKIRCLFPQNPMLALAEVVIEIGLIDCQRRKGGELLDKAGPALLESIRTFLQAHPDRRFEERIGFDQMVKVFPVYEGQQVGDPIVGQGRDISLHGMGIYLPARPATPHVCVQLTWSNTATPMTVLAQVKSSRAIADGRQLVGLFFLQILQA